MSREECRREERRREEKRRREERRREEKGGRGNFITVERKRSS
jgi:hypothetical protein